MRSGKNGTIKKSIEASAQKEQNRSRSTRDHLVESRILGHWERIKENWQSKGEKGGTIDTFFTDKS